MALNLEGSFVEESPNFLLCNVDEVPFCFLGLPIGANPKRSSTRKPVLDSLQWLLYLLRNLQVQCTRLPLIYCVNQITSYIAENQVYHERTKH